MENSRILAMDSSKVRPGRPQTALEKAHRALRALREGGRAVRCAADEAELLRKVCRIIVQVGGYRLAWVGLAQDDQGQTVLPVAQAGFGNGNLKRVRATWADADHGRDPVGAAIRTGRPAITKKVSADAGCLPGGTAARRGLASFAALPLKDRGRTFGALGIYAGEPDAFDEDELSLLEELADSLAYGLKALEVRTRQRRAETALKEVWLGTISALATAGGMRDSYTAGHQQRVARLSQAIGLELGLPEDRQEGLRLAGTLHDIGKIRIPSEILAHPGVLSPLEFGLIKTHPEIGYEILKPIEFPWPIATAVLQHHERMDGSGYPHGLSGPEILLEARILAVADVVEAMATHRPYRPAMDLEEAIDEITRNRDSLYDPEVVDACLKVVKEKGLDFSLPG